MTVRVIALESCNATHSLSVSPKRSLGCTELLHENPQWPLGVGLNFTHTRQKLSIQVAARGLRKLSRVFAKRCKNTRQLTPPVSKALAGLMWCLFGGLVPVALAPGS